MTIFIMLDGPSRNTYNAPSGTMYRVNKKVAFEVIHEVDIEYFRKKDTFEEITSSQPEVTSTSSTSIPTGTDKSGTDVPTGIDTSSNEN